MRILIDQSGYDLLNLGDVAMLQGCVARLRQQWPTAEILVIAHAPDRLRRYCPDTTAILPTFAELRGLKVFPERRDTHRNSFGRSLGHRSMAASGVASREMPSRRHGPEPPSRGCTGLTSSWRVAVVI